MERGGRRGSGNKSTCTYFTVHILIHIKSACIMYMYMCKYMHIGSLMVHVLYF